MRIVRVGVAVVLVAAAVVVALLAADVRGWSKAMSSGDAVYDATPLSATWTPATRLPASWSRGLLGLQDDLAMRHALQLYRANVGVRARLDNAVQVEEARAAAEAQLSDIARGGDTTRDSQAETLLGVLAFGDYSQGQQSSQADEAVSAFTDAVKLDPGNAIAKYDLEVLLRQLIAHGSTVGSQAGAGFGPGKHGAAGGVAGRGY
ncbi:MAG TPA: hypothetical protein VKR23_06960 [Gaiellaceae bacterium]|nr:hypothetical protein [Gaiellaceae bacterium]